MKFPEDQPAARYFATTQWGVVAEARTNNSAEALERLCRTYWYPVCSFIRRHGYNLHDAEDLTQEFFAQHLARSFLRNVDPAKGKFRTFLLTLLNHFLINQGQRAKAQKRGGQFTFVPLDPNPETDRYFCEPVADLSPEEVFDQRWALVMFEQALQRLQQEFALAGKADQFEVLRGFLEGDCDPGEYKAIGARLAMSSGAVAVTVHRLRQRFSAAIREQIAQTVANPADVEAEMRYLLAAISR